MPEYSQLDSKDVARITAEFGLGRIRELTPQGGWTNSNCRIVTDRGTYLVKVNTEQSREELQCCVEVAARLKEHRFPAALPLPRANGDRILSLGERLAMAYTFLPGRPPLPSAEIAGRIGRTLAQLHRIPPPAGLGPFSWSVSAVRTVRREAAASGLADHPFCRWMLEAGELARPPRDEALVRGLVHGDLFPDNTLFEDGELVAILDFDEACQDTLLIDLGMAIVGFCWDEANRRRDDWIGALLDGYRDLRELTSAERALLNRYVVFAALSVAAWRFLQFNVRFPEFGLTSRYLEMTERTDQCRDAPIVI